MHSPTEKKSAIIVLLIARFVIVEYCTILIDNIEKMHPVAIYHPLEVLIGISLIQVIKNSCKPCFSTPQKLEIKFNMLNQC